MHPNAQAITDFYEGFSRLDPAPMVKLYAANAEFSDPAFPHLTGDEVGDMWTMLCKRAKGFSLTFRDVSADDTQGKAHWEADYLFQGGRKVHNVIDAAFTFQNGKVVKHVDTFDFYRWSKMALGAPGLLLGWTGFLQKKVQGQAMKGLQEFRSKK